MASNLWNPTFLVCETVNSRTGTAHSFPLMRRSYFFIGSYRWAICCCLGGLCNDCWWRKWISTVFNCIIPVWSSKQSNSQLDGESKRKREGGFYEIQTFSSGFHQQLSELSIIVAWTASQLQKHKRFTKSQKLDWTLREWNENCSTGLIVVILATRDNKLHWLDIVWLRYWACVRQSCNFSCSVEPR